VSHSVGKSGESPGRVMHVGVVCGPRLLTNDQRASLGRQLQLIAQKNDDHLLILHHGCGYDGDEVAHRVVQKLGKWQIQGHPALSGPGGGVGLRAAATSGLRHIHESKIPAERDVDIANASRILIIIEDTRSRTPFDTIRKMAEAVGREVILLRTNGKPQKTSTVKPLKASPSRAKGKDTAWAARQARQDCAGGKVCRKYKVFRRAYRLEESDTSLRLWLAYHAEAGTNNKTPRRRANVLKYVGEPALKNGLKLETMAELNKLNQLDQLPDIWR
jgi:hypothetical protein